METTEIKLVKKLLDEVAYAPTKNDAKPALLRLESLSSQISSTTDSYSLRKLIEAIGFAKEASGQANNKSHWIQQMNNSWYIFENGIKTNNKDTQN